LNKAPDAFRTISEVADDLDLPQHVLRFWESRFSQIKPMKRGGGRRYYRPDDVDLLRGIRHLLYGDGYTIRGVQRILREQGVRAVQSIGQGQAVPLPAPSPEDDDVHEAEPGAPDDAEAESGEVEVLPPLFSAAASKSSASRPVKGASPASPPARPLSAESIERLKRALADLEEARRLLTKAAGK
jgi:DNA-binding transcriptional MerR regulator